MKNYAIIQNNKVINTVIAEEHYASEQGWVELADGAGINFDYINGQFIDNRPKPEIIEQPQPTKEELLAKLQELTNQINALG